MLSRSICDEWGGQKNIADTDGFLYSETCL